MYTQDNENIFNIIIKNEKYGKEITNEIIKYVNIKNLSDRQIVEIHALQCRFGLEDDILEIVNKYPQICRYKYNEEIDDNKDNNSDIINGFNKLLFNNYNDNDWLVLYENIGIYCKHTEIIDHIKTKIDNEQLLGGDNYEQKTQLQNISKDSLLNILLLGSSNSGKSTLKKQIQLIYGETWDERERLLVRDQIRTSIVEIIISWIQELKHNELKLSKNAKKSEDFMLNLKTDVAFDSPHIVDHIKILWSENAIQRLYNDKLVYNVSTLNMEYFVANIKRISQQDYIPSDEDILRNSRPTTGIINSRYEILESNYEIFDVGGRKSERRKWIHVFEDVLMFIFVVSLNGYNEKLHEDEMENQIDDALRLFKQICNHNYLENSKKVLLFTKKDLFMQTIKTIPLNVCDSFKEYKGENTYNECLQFIQKKFKDQNNNTDEKIDCYVVNAIDTNDVKDAMHQIFIKINDSTEYFKYWLKNEVKLYDKYFDTFRINDYNHMKNVIKLTNDDLINILKITDKKDRIRILECIEKYQNKTDEQDTIVYND